MGVFDFCLLKSCASIRRKARPQEGTIRPRFDDHLSGTDQKKKKLKEGQRGVRIGDRRRLE